MRPSDPETGKPGAVEDPSDGAAPLVSEKVRIVRAAGTVGAATLSSRLLGYVRDMAIAWYFGAGAGTDAFIAAFRIPNLVRRLFGEGTLSATFIPVFTEVLYRRGRPEAFAMARSALRLWASALALFVVAAVVFAPQLMHLLAYGFSVEPPKLALTVLLSRVMAPYIFFIGMVALCMGILNPLGHFAAPALAPVALNLAMIAAVLFLAPLLPPGIDPTVALAIGVLSGGALQLVMQVPFVVKQGVLTPDGAPRLLHPDLKRTFPLMVPTVLGSAVYQINILFITVFASLQPEGSLSCLYFADRLIQFPLGLFGIAAATAALPSLARQAAAGDLDALKTTSSQALRMVLFITLPSMAGLIVLRDPIVRLLFERGAFDSQATRLTADALLYYAFGLWAVAGSRIVIQALYALQDTLTPVVAAGISIGANLILMALLAAPMGPAGLALAVSLASVLNLGLLLLFLRRKIGRLGGAGIVASTLKSAMSTTVMAAVIWGAGQRWLEPTSTDGVEGLFGLIASIAAGVGIYAATAAVLRSREFGSILNLVRKRGHLP